MLELNNWFFIQLISFLILVVLLNTILFKPLLRIFREREDHVKGSLDSVKIMGEEKDNLLRQVEKKVSEARNQARTIFEELSKEGMEIQKQTLDAAQKDAAEINRKTKEDLEATVKETREALRKDVEAFVSKIVEKMVGV
ncbi:MAG: F0F1 ATP synthase subunit B [Candidatus Scalindua sp.]